MTNGSDRMLVSADLDSHGIERVKAALEAGAVIGVPTDTVYGLAVLPGAPRAIDRLFELKSRPESIAVAVLVADVSQAYQLLEMEEGIALVAETFWPGALTVVGRRAPGVDYELGGDESTIGVRCPKAPFVTELCRRVGPIAVTSANRHGDPPATNAAELRALFGPQLLIVDGGECRGEPSTVVNLCSGTPRCLRAGAVDYDSVADTYLAAIGHGGR